MGELVVTAPMARVAEPVSDPVRELSLFASLPNRGVFIPRHVSGKNRTPSKAAAIRSTLSFREPARSATRVLIDTGLEPAAAKLQDREKATGIFKNLDMLGVAAAAFRDAGELEKAKAELEQDYEFVPDFALRLPDPLPRISARLTGPDAQDKLASSHWPENSGVAEAHDGGIRGKGVLVGALDTGVDSGHQEFQGRDIDFRYVSFYPNSPSWPSRDVFGFDTDSHGTHVSGIISGTARGIAPDAQLHVASVIESETTLTSLSRVISGLDWLLRKFAEDKNKDLPAVINLSLGFPSAATPDISRADYETRIRAIRYIVDDLLDANVLTIAAIGNSGEDTFGYPGGFGQTLGVGAIDFNHNVASFSGNRRPVAGPIEAEKPDLVGYGVDVYSCIERDCAGRSFYSQMSGTSMASPYVTGIAALYRCANPRLDARTVRQKMLDTCLPLPGQPRHRVGAGLARFVAADGTV